MADRNSLPPEVIEAILRGNKIEAIKLLREAMRLGLAEAKSIVEAHETITGAKAKGQPPPKPKPAREVRTYSRHRDQELSPGEEPRSSASPFGVILAIVAVIAAAWLYVKFG